VGIVAAVYLATLAVLPRDGFWTIDNGCKFIQMEGLLRTHYRDFSVPWPGRTLDPEYTYQPLPKPFGYVVDGKLYSRYSPVFAMLASVPYRVLGWWGLYVIPLLGGLLILPAVWGLAGLLGSGNLGKTVAVLITAFATPMWFYSLTFWEHTPAACLAVWSVWAGVQYLTLRRPLYLLAAGILAGLAVYFRDEQYVFAVVLGIMLAVRAKRWGGLALFALGAVVVLVPWWWFQAVAIRTPLGHHFGLYAPLAGGFGAYWLERWEVLRAVLINSHEYATVSFLMCAPFLVCLVWRPILRRPHLAAGLAGIAGLGLAAGVVVCCGYLTAERPVWYLLHANSLFAAAPVLILGLPRLSLAVTHTPSGDGEGNMESAGHILGLLALIFPLVYVFVVPDVGMGGTGIHWGCRFLLPLCPLLAAPAGVLLEGWWRNDGRRLRVVTLLLAGVVMVSVGAQWHSLRLLYLRQRFDAHVNSVVAARPESIVLTHTWFVAAELCHSFYTKSVFLLPPGGSLDALLEPAYRAGYRAALWVDAVDPRLPLDVEDQLLADGNLDFVSLRLRPLRLEE